MNREELFDTYIISTIIKIFYSSIPKIVNINYNFKCLYYKLLHFRRKNAMALTGMYCEPCLKNSISPKVVNESIAIVCSKHWSMKHHLILSIRILLICCLEPKHLKTGIGNIIKNISRSTIMPISTNSISSITLKGFSDNFKNLNPSKYQTMRITKN